MPPHPVAQPRPLRGSTRPSAQLPQEPSASHQQATDDQIAAPVAVGIRPCGLRRRRQRRGCSCPAAAVARRRGTRGDAARAAGAYQLPTHPPAYSRTYLLLACSQLKWLPTRLFMCRRSYRRPPRRALTAALPPRAQNPAYPCRDQPVDVQRPQQRPACRRVHPRSAPRHAPRSEGPQAVVARRRQRR